MKSFFKKAASMILVLAMVVTLLQTALGQALVVKAAEGDTNITIHFYNEYNWSTPAVQYWGGNNTTVSLNSAEATEITGWGGVMGYAMTAELNEPGWYVLQLCGDFNGFQFLNMDNPSYDYTYGKGFHSYMTQYTEETAKDLYCKYNEETGYECEWYLDRTCKTRLAAPGETGDDETGEETTSSNVSDRVQLQVSEQTVEMQLYKNGVYEAACELPEGTHEAKVLVNGSVTGETDSVTLTASKTVYFRMSEGVITDSVNTPDMLHTAAFTGDFSQLEFLSNPTDESSVYTITSWGPKNENAELSYLGGGIYSRTFYLKELTSDVTFKYKVAFDDDWNYSLGDNGQDISVTIPAGATEISVFVDEINGVVYDSVRTPAFEIAQNGDNVTGTPFSTVVSLIGSVRGENDWKQDAVGYEFSQISDTLYRYQKVFAAGSYEYKCVFNGEKWYEAESGNRKLNITEDDTNVVFLYDTTTGLLKDSYNNASEVAQLLGMEAIPEAPAQAKVTDQANGTTQFTMPAENESNVKLYYADKEDVLNGVDGAFSVVTLTRTGNGVFTSENLFFGDEALDLVYYYEIDGTRTLDVSREAVTIANTSYSSYTREAFLGRLVNVPGTFPGPSWDAASNVMTYEGEGLYKYTFKNIGAANYEFKISMGTWTENYGVGGVPDGDNYSISVPSTQDVTVFYNDFSHLAVTTLDYIFADISLTGTSIPEGTTLSDNGLTGIYATTVAMAAGTYTDVKMHDNDNDKEYSFDEIVVSEDKEVTFYFDPSSEVFYCDASDIAMDEDAIYFNTKETAYKSVYGAVATGEDVTFTIETGADIDTVRMVVKGVEKKVLSLEKDGTCVDGVQKWSTTTSFQTIGENSYYFVLSNGSTVKIYADDDGYYGEGTVTDLTNITPYDIVVYKEGFETPDWMKDAVVYQIFPDRFYDGDVSNDFAQTSARGEEDYEYVTDWSTLPENPEQEALLDQETYEATGAYFGDGSWSNEIYGGDLEGITERIDYLKALGINVIYLNPVFASISSHRYDTSDYEAIDPILGDLGDFTELVEVAEANDMHIVLDGVFNHVSDDSKYFDRYYKYLEAGTDAVGAYPYWAYVYDYMAENEVDQAVAQETANEYFSENYGITDFSYTEWFAVSKDAYLTDDTGNVVADGIGLRAGKAVYSYEGWWGYDSMPVVKSTNGSEYQTGNWAEEMIGNNNQTSVTQYWLTEGSNGWRLDVANEVSDETWQNFRASVKALDSDAVIIGEIWDDATEYLLGDMYDSVMNYVFRGAVLSYAMGGDANAMEQTLEKIRERYPQEAFYAMMNLVGSHDTTRVLSYLDGIGDDRKDTSIKAAFPTYETTSDLAKAQQYLVAFLQFTYAGAPTIYYGDEIGMVGADDPDDRRAFTWGQGNKELVTWYATLAQIRNQYEALRTGSVEVFETESADQNIVSYVRRDKQDTLIVLANNAKEDKTVVIDLSEIQVSGNSFTDLISGGTVISNEGTVTVTVPALSGSILTTSPKNILVNEAALAPAYDPAYIVEERIVATSIVLNQTNATLEKGSNVTLSAIVTPDQATEGGAVSWTSSDETVAKVDEKGVVTAVGTGNATITATAMYSVKHCQATCSVTVTEKENDNTGDGGNTGGSGITGDITVDANLSVTVSGMEGWIDVIGMIGTAAGEVEINVVLDGTTDAISGTVIGTLAGTKVTLKVKLQNGITWKIDGSKLRTGTNYRDIDLGVSMNTANIPTNVMATLPEAKKAIQLSLDFNGEFGYEMVMNVPLGAENSGYFANLYYYNAATGKLEFVNASKIAADGFADLGFTHASDYVIVISEKDLEEEALVTAVDTGDDAPLAAGLFVLLGMICMGAGVLRTTRKKRV